MKKSLIVVWIDGSISSAEALEDVSPVFIKNGNVTAVINIEDETYLDLDEINAGVWRPLPKAEKQVHTYATAE